MRAVRPAVRKLTARVRLLMEWIPHRSRPVLGDWQKVSSAGMTDKGIASSSCVRVDADRGRLLRKRSAFGRAARYDLPKTGDRLVSIRQSVGRNRLVTFCCGLKRAT